MANDKLNKIEFLLLQFFWILRIFFEGMVSVFKRTPLPDLIPPLPSPEKRHFIQLYTVEPEKSNDRPTCYMDVFEINSENEARKLRKNSEASGSRRNAFLRYKPEFCRSKSDGNLQRLFCSKYTLKF